VYSLGCILNECWTRQQPWRESAHFFQVQALFCAAVCPCRRPIQMQSTALQIQFNQFKMQFMHGSGGHCSMLCQDQRLILFDRSQGKRSMMRFVCLLPQIIKQVAIDGERPAVASDTPPQLRRLIRKCWEQVRDFEAALALRMKASSCCWAACLEASKLQSSGGKFSFQGSAIRRSQMQDPRHRPSCTELVRFTDILMRHEVARLRASAGRGSANGARLPPAGSAGSAALAPTFEGGVAAAMGSSPRSPAARAAASSTKAGSPSADGSAPGDGARSASAASAAEYSAGSGAGSGADADGGAAAAADSSSVNAAPSPADSAADRPRSGGSDSDGGGGGDGGCSEVPADSGVDTAAAGRVSSAAPEAATPRAGKASRAETLAGSAAEPGRLRSRSEAGHSPAKQLPCDGGASSGGALSRSTEVQAAIAALRREARQRREQLSRSH